MINRNPVPEGTVFRLLGLFNLTVWSDPSWYGILILYFLWGLVDTAALCR